MNSKFKEFSLLAKQGNSKEFFDQLFELWREKKSKNEDVGEITELMVSLNKAEGVDFCQKGLEAVESGFRIFDLMSLLEDALLKFDLIPETLLELFEKQFEDTKNDLMAGIQYRPIKGLVEFQPEFSRELLDKLLNLDRPFVVGYIANFFQNFFKNAPKAIHKELDSLKTHHSINVTNGAVNALGSIDYSRKESKEFLKVTIEIFDTLEGRGEDAIDFCVTHAYGNLLKVYPKASEKIRHYIKKNKPNIDYAVSSILFHNSDEYGDEAWFQEFLLELSRTSAKHKGILDNLDYVLSHFIEKKKNWELVEKFLIQWLKSSDYNGQDDKLAKLFDSTHFAIIKDQTNLQKLITRFFNHENHEIHSAASEIIRHCNLHKLSPLELDKEELTGLKYEDLLYVGRKILGYVIDSKTQCSLTFSLLNQSPRNKKLQVLVRAIFINHIGQDYPGSTIEFLKQEVSKTKSQNKIAVANTIIKDIKGYISARDSLQNLKEVIPASQPTNKILLEQSKVMNLAMENAQEGSIVAKIAMKITLKHGNGSFHYIRGNYSPISRLSSFSTSIEMPSSERSHPVHAAIERLGFRTAKRGD